MKLMVSVTEQREIEIDESLFEIYAEEVRDRFSLGVKGNVNMTDILIQAGLDGDIELPDEFTLEDYDDDFTPEEILLMGERRSDD